MARDKAGCVESTHTMGLIEQPELLRRHRLTVAEYLFG